MRAMWKGSISFGLVNIPVRLFAATEKKDLKFRYLHAPCHTPLEYQKVCSTCKTEVPWEEIIRGYEYERGRFVVLSEEEIDAAAGEKERLIEIQDFIQLEEIDPVYFQNSYYLAPDGPGGRPYLLLWEAMRETGKIALATVTLRTKESMAVVRTYKEVLSLSTMFYPDEVRSVQDLPDLPKGLEVREKELVMAKELILNLSTSFEPEKYKDSYRNKLLDVIQAKVEGKEIAVAPSPEREKVVDLLEALQASVKKSREKTEKAGKRDSNRKLSSRKEKATVAKK
ncbi:MAG: Ku protein [Firmicutes bacterium]|nr:Ku protein [Bacillota bacterium]